MKKKQTTYILIPVVILVWGLVFYKVWSAIGGDDNDMVTYKNVAKEEVVDKLANDSFALIANYRDPFLGKSISKDYERPVITYNNYTTQTPVVKKENKKKEEKSTVQWPAVQYVGMTENRVTGARVGIIKVNQKEVTVKEKTTVGELLVGKIYKDSIQVQFNKETKYIKR